jgi:hypothetical protein
MLPQQSIITDPNVLLMNYATALYGNQPVPNHVPTSDEALLALNLFYVQSAMAQLAAQKEMLNNRIYGYPFNQNQMVRSPIGSSESSGISSPASMSPTRTESPEPLKTNPYRRKRSSDQLLPKAKKSKNSPSPPQNTIKVSTTHTGQIDLKQTFLDLYEVYGVIGVGGGGMVYAGRRITDKLPVAIKRVMREKVKRWEKVQGHNVPQEIALMLR